MKIGVIRNDFEGRQRFDAASRKPVNNCEIIYDISKMGSKGLLEEYMIELDKTSLAD